MYSAAIILSHKLRFLSETSKACEDFDILKIFQLIEFENLEIDPNRLPAADKGPFPSTKVIKFEDFVVIITKNPNNNYYCPFARVSYIANFRP